MKRNYLLCILLVILTLSLAESILAQERIVAPNRWYVKKERGFDDWVVEFSLPKNIQIRQIYSTGNAKDVGLFDKSDTTKQPVTNYDRKVFVVAGGLARLETGYRSSIDTWAKTLRVRYIIVELRGSPPPRGRP